MIEHHIQRALWVLRCVKLSASKLDGALDASPKRHAVEFLAEVVCQEGEQILNNRQDLVFAQRFFLRHTVRLGKKAHKFILPAKINFH